MDNLYYFQNIYLIEDHINILDIYKTFSYRLKDNLNISKFIHYFKEQKIYTQINDFPSIKYFMNQMNKNGLLLFENIFYIYYYVIYNKIYTIDFYFGNKYLIQSNKNIIYQNFFENIQNIYNKSDFNEVIKNYNLHSVSEKILFDYYLYFSNGNIDIYENFNSLNKDIYKVKSSSLFDLYKTLFHNEYINDKQFYFYLKNNKHILDSQTFSTTFNDIYIPNLTHKNNRQISIYFLNNYLKKSSTIFSKKIFYLLYPNFDINFFKEIYHSYLIKNNIDIDDDFKILNYYYQFYLKDNINFKNILKNNIYPSLLFHSYNHFMNYYSDNLDFNLIKYVYLDDNNIDEYKIISFIIDNPNIIFNYNIFLSTYKDFNLKLFLTFNNYSFSSNYSIIYYLINNENCIYSIKTFMNKNREFNFIFYKSFYNLDLKKEEDIIIHYYINKNSKTLINEKGIINIYNIEFIKCFNQKINHLELLDLSKLLLFSNDKINYITQYKQFVIKYIEKLNHYKIYLDNEEVSKLINILNKLNKEDELLLFFNYDIYNLELKKEYIGRKNVFFVEEVLIDLKKPKPQLKNGISLIIRAKNEENNIKACIESVVDLVDEIIFVNNNSTDNTLKIIEEYAIKYPIIKVYNYFIDVNKVGKEHYEAIKNNDKNTLGNFYNWCLSKSTMKNIIKWDADFICIRNNFKQMIKNYQIKNKIDKFALWFSGYTLFINNNDCFININSYYDEFRLFSYENGYKWYDGELCEYNVPYLENCKNKYYFRAPLFYEIKRTNEDEFSSRSSLLDQRDIKDYNLLQLLRDKETDQNELLKINHKNINKVYNIIILTNSLGIGGSNIFIIELYNFFKFLGFNIYIFTDVIDKKTNVFQIINEYEIYKIKDINYFIDNNSIDYIFFNSFIHDDFKFLLEYDNIHKIFITHSDVAYSNYYIKLYHQKLNKILTVNQYTKEKLIKFLNIDENKIKMIVNYKNYNKNINNEINTTKNELIKKNYKFGVITRFSDDKNIIMLLFSLQKIFLNQEYEHYKFYLVGYENDFIYSYMQFLVKYLNIEKFVYFEGYQNNIKKYYDLFDFIILPSVSEGCPYNVLESMFYEKLIILSDVGGNKELFPNDTTFFIHYDGIKEFEASNLYINNYYGQLEKLGYIINYENILDNYKIDIDFDVHQLNVIPPLFLTPNKSNLQKYTISLNIWNRNVNQIYNTIIKAIQIDTEKELLFNKENKHFIDTHFNKNIYYSTLLNIIYE
mgnify:CR=1 FL=1